MKSWFHQFHKDLKTQTLSTKLVGAGTSTPERAFAHYRYQHEIKIREATEETFSTLKEILGTEWNKVWQAFRESSPPSPRSLDYYSKVFLDWYRKTSAPLHHQELARFEYLMDIHPWTHESLDVLPLPELTEDTKLIVSPLDFHRFDAPVSALYRGHEVQNLTEKTIVLLWFNDGSVNFRQMESWELEVLKNLSRGLAVALESAPEDDEKVGAFFQWLGTSGLIRGILH